MNDGVIVIVFTLLCKPKGIWAGGFGHVHMGYQRLSHNAGRDPWLRGPWARRCNKLHSTICIVLLSELVSWKVWL